MKALSPYPSVCRSESIAQATHLPRVKPVDLSILARFAPALVVGITLVLLALVVVQPGSSQFDRIAAAWLGQAGLLLIAAAFLAERLSTMLQLTAGGLAVAVMALAGLSQPGLLPLAAMLSTMTGALAVGATGYRQLFVAWVVFHAIAALVLALT